MQIVETLQVLYALNSSNSEKVSCSITALNEMMETYLSNPALQTRKVKMLVLSKDILGDSALTYFEKHDVYNLLNTKIIKEVMDDIIHGVADMQSSFLTDSSFWSIVTDFNNGV